jgi:hypothetical protein
MSNQINDGGPAFPLGPTASTMKPHADGGGHMIVTHYGMERGISIRDYFAAAALKGQAHRFAHPHEHRELLAQDCYDIADAMLKARETK